MEQDEKVCPACAETIKAAAVKCKHCGEMLGSPAAAPYEPPAPVEPPPMNTAAAVGGGAAGAATGGCLAAGLGMWVGAAMCALGGLACLTGVGAIVGVPMIIGGVLCPVLGGLMGGAAGGAAGASAGATHGLTPEQKANLGKTGLAAPSGQIPGNVNMPPWVLPAIMLVFAAYCLWLFKPWA